MEMMNYTPQNQNQNQKQNQNQNQNMSCSCCGFANFLMGRIRKLGFRITGRKKRSISADTKKKGCKPHNIINSSFMDLPSDVIFDIFSRVRVKCLARSRCVSKVWCSYIDDRYLTIIHDKRVVEEPTPILYHQNLSRDRMNFHVIESKQPGRVPHTYVLKPRKEPCFEYLLKVPPPSRYSIFDTKVRGSCNGLLFLSEDNGYVITSMAVVHPLRKECYEIPPFPLRLKKRMCRESCALGFDAFTNTYKLVCVLLKEHTPSNKPDMLRKNLCTMVHVFGTNSWREIPKIPSYPVRDNAVFANGCLHWLVSYIDIKPEDVVREVIWFDVNKEEFGLIKHPERIHLCGHWNCFRGGLVDLNGEVGYVVCGRTMEIWVLKQKEWVPHCRFKEEIIPHGYIDVVGCWNKDGDILIKIIGGSMKLYTFFVYNRKSGGLLKTNFDVLGGNHIFMYPNTLSSIHDINTNPSP